MADHPRIKAADEVGAVAVEEVNLAYSAFYPTVNLAGDAGYEHVNNPTRRSTNNPADSAYNRGRETTTFTVTQNLYRGGRNSAELRAAEIGRDAAEFYRSEQAQKAMKEGIQAYLQFLEYSQNLSSARDNVQKIQAQSNLEDERVRLGGGVSLDVLESKRRLMIAKFREVEMVGSMEIVVGQYIKMFGHGPDYASMTVPTVPKTLVPNSLDEATDLAMKSNPTLLKLENLMQSSAVKKSVEESGYMPTVDLVFEHNYENDLNTVVGIRRDWNLLLKANWELFSGFKTKAGVAQASHNYEAAKNDLLDNKRTIAEQVKKAWETMQYNLAGVTYYQNNLNLAQEVFEGTKAQREAGKETLIRVLDSELALFEAKVLLTTTKFRYLLAVYDLLYSMGTLTPDVGEQDAPVIEVPDTEMLSPLPAPEAAITPPTDGTVPSAPEAPIAAPQGGVDTMDLNAPPDAPVAPTQVDTMDLTAPPAPP